MTLEQFRGMLRDTRKVVAVKLDLYQRGKDNYSSPVPAFNKNQFVINNEDVTNNEDSVPGADRWEKPSLETIDIENCEYHTMRALRIIELKKKIWQTCLNRSQLCLILLKRLWTKYCKRD